MAVPYHIHLIFVKNEFDYNIYFYTFSNAHTVQDVYMKY